MIGDIEGARKFGVRSAMPSVTAKRRCPELVFVKPRFDVYRAVSHQVRAIFADYTVTESGAWIPGTRKA